MVRQEKKKSDADFYKLVANSLKQKISERYPRNLFKSHLKRFKLFHLLFSYSKWEDSGELIIPLSKLIKSPLSKEYDEYFKNPSTELLTSFWSRSNKAISELNNFLRFTKIGNLRMIDVISIHKPDKMDAFSLQYGDTFKNTHLHYPLSKLQKEILNKNLSFFNEDFKATSNKFYKGIINGHDSVSEKAVQKNSTEKHNATLANIVNSFDSMVEQALTFVIDRKRIWEIKGHFFIGTDNNHAMFNTISFDICCAKLLEGLAEYTIKHLSKENIEHIIEVLTTIKEHQFTNSKTINELIINLIRCKTQKDIRLIFRKEDLIHQPFNTKSFKNLYEIEYEFSIFRNKFCLKKIPFYRRHEVIKSIGIDVPTLLKSAIVVIDKTPEPSDHGLRYNGEFYKFNDNLLMLDKNIEFLEWLKATINQSLGNGSKLNLNNIEVTSRFDDEIYTLEYLYENFIINGAEENFHSVHIHNSLKNYYSFAKKIMLRIDNLLVERKYDQTILLLHILKNTEPVYEYVFTFDSWIQSVLKLKIA